MMLLDAPGWTRKASQHPAHPTVALNSSDSIFIMNIRYHLSNMKSIIRDLYCLHVIDVCKLFQLCCIFDDNFC